MSYIKLDDESTQFLKVLETSKSPKYRKYIFPENPKNFLQSNPNLGYECWYDEEGRVLKGIVKFGENIEGPPNFVHGGCTATICDALLGTLCWAMGYRAFTASLTVNYKSVIPINTIVHFSAEVEKIIEDRKIFVRMDLFRGDKKFDDAQAVFIVPKQK